MVSVVGVITCHWGHPHRPCACPTVFVDDDGGGEVDIDEMLAFLERDEGEIAAAEKAWLEKKRRRMKATSLAARRAASPPRGGPRLKELRGKETPMQVLKRKLRAASYSVGGVDYARLFRHYDRDNGGSLEFEEFRSALRRDAKIR